MIQKTPRPRNKAKKKPQNFTAEERAAMRERAKELKAGADKAAGESAVLAAIAKMPEPDRSLGKRLRHHQGDRAGAVAENLVRHARLCEGRKHRLFFPERQQVQDALRHPGL